MNKLKLLTIRALSVITCMVLALSAAAYDFAVDGIYYTANGTNASVTYKDTNYNSYSGTVNIPATVTNGGTTYTVSTIGYQAFRNCTGLKRVVMPNTVEYIAAYAFYGCSALTNITIPASVYTIYQNTFNACNELKSVICLSTQAAGQNNVGANCFSATTFSNATLYVPFGTVDTFSANTSCWGNFASIHEIGCDFVEDAIFYKDLGDNKAAVTSVNVDDVADSYSGDVVVPPTVTHDGQDFTVTAVAFQGFYGNQGLNSVSLPSTVNIIDLYAFYACRNLTQVNIPEGVTDIEYCAFGMCPRLPSIIIPKSVTRIAQNAFSDCQSLTSITCRATEPPACSDVNCFHSSLYTNATLYVPSNSVEQYRQAYVWQNFGNIVGKDYDFEANGIYYIITGPNTASVTFRDRNYHSYSGSVDVPSTVIHDGITYTVTAIGRGAFYQCPELTAVTLPNTITVIDYAAFYQCTSLTSLTIPNSVVTLGEYALHTSGITQVTIGDHVTEIGKACFGRCTSLISVDLPNSVTTLGDMCFQECTALQSASIGTGVTLIPNQCFAFCQALTSIDMPNVEEINPFAFLGTGFTSISLPEGLKTVHYYAFSDCSNLTTITFPASVSQIDELVLEGSNALASISVNSNNPYYSSIYGELWDKNETILLRYPPQKNYEYALTPTSCVTIARAAYQGAAHLKTISIGPNVEFIHDNAFEGCSALTEFRVDENNPYFMADDGVLIAKENGIPKTVIRYPCNKPGKHYSLPNTCDSIATYAFEQSLKLESVYIPSSVKAMGELAFSNSEVKRVVIDEGMKSIPYGAFYACTNLESVYLPSTITDIDYRAFYYSVNLNEMTIAVNGRAPSIGQEAFYGMAYYTDNNYATVYVPDGMASQYSGLDEWLDDYGHFTGISTVTSGTEFTVDSLMYITTDNQLNTMVTDATSTNLFDPGIPPKVAYQGNLCTVTKLGSNSLAYCTRMVRAEVPFTVTLMDGYSFYGNTNLSKLRLHEGLKQISQFSISHVNGLTSLTIPASVDSIAGSFANYSDNLVVILVEDGNTKYTDANGVLFTKDKKMLVAFPHANTSNYTVPDGTEVIGSCSFRGATRLENVDMPTSLREIQDDAFFDNSALTTVTVPRGVTTIGISAFSNCTSLTSAVLPSTLTSIGYLAFHNSGITTLMVKNPTPPTCQTKYDSRQHVWYYVFDDSHYANCTLIVPRGSKAAYQAAATWKNFTHIIEADFPSEVKRGDVNNDDIVDIDDVTQLISYVLGNGNDINLVAADVNDDGGIDIDDITVVINYILNGSWPELADIDMWYLAGDHIGIYPWWNDPTTVGTGIIPLYPVGPFNAQGKGLLTYTGFFSPDDWVTVIHTPGSWDEMAGSDGNGEWGIGEGFYSFQANGYGFYTISMNTATGEFSFTPYTGATPVVHSSMNMPSDYCSWAVDDPAFSMNNLNPTKENHDWVLRSVTFEFDGQLKFAADEGWTYNWGAEEFPYGIGVQNGLNIPVKAGTYDVFFNDLTGHYNFIKR